MKKLIICLFVATLAITVSADLIITEAVDGTLSGGLPKALEICNTGSTSVDLSAYEIALYANGNSTVQTLTQLSGTIGSKSAYTLTASGSSDAYVSVWGGAPDAPSISAVNSNGDDVYALRLVSDHSVVDVCGVIGVDGSGQPWEYLDSWIKRSTTITTSADTFNSDNWTYGGANAMDGYDAAQIAAAVPGMGVYEQIPEPAVFGVIALALLFFRKK